MSYRNIVEKRNAEIFKLPAGWDSREQVAKDLECAPERVHENLRHALNARDVESKVFRVWDKANKRIISVTAYREVAKKAAAK